MPGYARTEKGEGLIRSHELLEVLVADIDTAYRMLDAERASQLLRRCVVRANFSFIEAAIECIKVELRSAVRLGKFPKSSITEKDQETLGSLAVVAKRPTKFLPLDENLKRTFRLAAKIWRLKFQLTTDGQEYRCFSASKDARNRLTHPRTFYDVEVTNEDMHNHSVTIMWFRGEFRRLFEARVWSIAESLPNEDRQSLLDAVFAQAPSA